MVNVLGFDLGIQAPKFMSFTGFGGTVSIILGIVIVLIFIGIFIWLYIQNKAYYIQIRDFENISGRGFQLVGKNRARLIKIGDGGEELLYLRRGKSFRTAYGRKMGRNEYWFARGQDGYFYNVVLGDLDAKMGMLDIEPIDRDMRYMHVAIRKNIQDRYKREDKFSKYVPLAVSFIVLIVLFIGMWFLISKMGDLIKESTRMIEASKPIADSLSNAVSKLDQICSPSGIKTST